MKFSHLSQSDIISIGNACESQEEFFRRLGISYHLNTRQRNSAIRQLLSMGVDISVFKEVWDKRLEDVEHVYRKYKRDAELTRNIYFELTLDEFEAIVLNNCYYCDSVPGRQYDRTKHVKMNGVDRKNSKIGYVLDNCVACCTECNIMKQKMSVKEFWLHIEKIYLNMRGFEFEESAV